MIRRAAIAGLVCAAAVAWFACPVPPRRPFTLDHLLRFAIYYTSITTIAGAAAAGVTQPISRLQIWRISRMAIWLAPLCVFLAERSILAAALGAIFLAVLTQECALPEGSRSEPMASRDMFAPIGDIRLMRQFPSSMFAGAMAELAAMTYLAEDLVLTVVFLTTAVAIVSTRILFNDRYASWAGALRVGLALLLTLVGLSRYLILSDGGTEGVTRANGNGVASHRRAEPVASLDAGGDYSGVILLPEPQPVVTLVPPLPAMNNSLFNKQRRAPLSIPFYGVYWFFRPPYRQPPRNSVTARGTPATKSFRSLGRIPLSMEAHQNLGKLIDLSCCSSIQVAIRNADPYPRTIAIELVLVNTSLPGKPFFSLGSQMVESSPLLRSEGAQAASEVLTFQVPPRHIQQFDEITIRFQPSRAREDRSARVAIERFILVPSGRSQ